MYVPGSSVPWVSSPELNVARSEIFGRSRRYLQSEHPDRPLCSRCRKPAYFNERISVSNVIFHKSCFRCRKCNTHLSIKNCILHRKRAYCEVHNRTKIWKLMPVSQSKLDQIKGRLDSKANLQKQNSTETKQQKRVFYAGIKSAKDKLEDSSKPKAQAPRQIKRITPPRDGVTAGVIESEPKPRDPNIVTADDTDDNALDYLVQSSSTKEKLAKFKELQRATSTDEDGQRTPTKTKDFVPIDTKSIRNRFLVGNSDGEPEKPKRINPTEEIQEMAKKENNAIYENEPEVRNDVVKADYQNGEQSVLISRNKAKEMKERFANYASDEQPKKSEKFQMELGEGGIYESQPKDRPEDVIKYNYEKDLSLPANSVKSGLQKFIEIQNTKPDAKQNEPVKLEIDQNFSGIYENIPSESQADITFNDSQDYLDGLRDKRYANDAKKVFLEKQKLEEESKQKRSTPQMIDIWKDLCPDSGVFENVPKPQDKEVVRSVRHEENLAVYDDNRINNDPSVETATENNNFTVQPENHVQ